MFTLMRLMCVICVLALPAAAMTQEVPNRSVKFIVPFPAGGPADTISRILTEKMATVLGQAIVIESRAGAGGLTGIASVAKAEPDGYTIAIAPASGLAMNVNLRETMPFQPLRDLALITQVVSVPEILVVSENVPVKSLAELVVRRSRSPANWHLPRLAPAACRISPWSCSSSPPRSTSCTCHTPAPHRP